MAQKPYFVSVKQNKQTNKQASKAVSSKEIAKLQNDQADVSKLGRYLDQLLTNCLNPRSRIYTQNSIRRLKNRIELHINPHKIYQYAY